MKRFGLTALAVGLSLVFAEAALAQFQNQQQSGGSTSGRSSSGTGAFGSTSRGGSIGSPNRSFAGGNQGAGGTGSGGGVAGQGAGQLNGNERFTRQGRQAGSFVGSDTQDVQNFVGALAAAQGAGRGQQNMFGGRNAMGGGRNGQFGQFEDQIENNAADQLQSQRRFRTKLTVGFQPPVRTSAVMATNLARVAKTIQRGVGQPVNVSLNDGLVVLTGTVPTSQERLLAEQLVLLEPGIGQVQNDLVVAGNTSSAP